MIISTFKCYSYIIVKEGKRINSAMRLTAKNAFLLATPVFPFTTSHYSEFEGNVRPAKLHHTLTKYRQTSETRSSTCFMHGLSKLLYFWKSLVQQPQRIFHKELSSTSKEYLKSSHFQHGSYECVLVFIPLVEWSIIVILFLYLQYTWILLLLSVCVYLFSLRIRIKVSTLYIAYNPEANSHNT